MTSENKINLHKNLLLACGFLFNFLTKYKEVLTKVLKYSSQEII